MKIIYGLEVFFPHISGVTIATNRLAMHFGRELSHQTWIITANDKRLIKLKNDPRGYTLIRLPAWPNPFRKGLKLSYFARKYVKKLLSQIKPDIIHIQDPGFVSQALAKESKKLNIPVIVTQHSNLLFPTAFLPKFLRKIGMKIYGHFLVRFVNTYCDLMTTPTETMKKDILSWGVKIPIQVVSNGINLKFFRPGKLNDKFIEKYQLKGLLDKPIVLYSGRIDKDKNLNTLIQAIPLVLKEIDCYFIFLGKGDIRPILEEKIKSLKLEQRVKFMGPVLPGDTALPEFYQASSIFAIPSTIEAQSLVTMEASASGLPIVAANSGALPELVKDQENGFLVSPFKPEEYAKSIVKILHDPNLRDKMSRKSLEIIKHYDQKLIRQKLLGVYETAINHRQIL